MSTLPNEVLTMVFKMMPLHCRSQIRLVCKRWNEACNVLSITKNEKIAIFDIYQLHLKVVLKTINKTKREVIHLVFRSLDLRSSSNIVFWQNSGAKILSLSFTECFLHDNVLKDILCNCPNLAELSFFACEYNADGRLFSAFDNLLKEPVVASNVTSLSLKAKNLLLDMECYYLCVKNLIQNVFPNVTELRLNLLSTNKIDTQMYQKLWFDNIVPVIMATKSKIKILELNIDWVHLLLKYEENPFDNLRELETLRLNGFMNYLPSPHKDRFLLLRNLTTFASDMKFSADFPRRQFLLSLLDCFPRLRCLELSDLHTSVIDPIIMDKLLLSSMKSLKLTFSSNDTDVKKITSYFPYNDSLEELELKSDNDVIGPFESVFIKYFRHLRTLLLDRSDSDTIMWNIMRYQKHLKNLTLKTKNEWPGREFGNPEETNQTEYLASVRNLSGLEYLNIRCDNISDMKLEMLPISFLPRLKYLDIVSSESSNIGSTGNFLSLLSAAEELSELEFIQISTDFPVPYYYLINQCRKHQRLKYLLIQDDYNNSDRFVKAEWERCFRIRSSLRVLSYNNLCFYKNAITNKIESVEVDEKRYICTFCLEPKFTAVDLDDDDDDDSVFSD